MTRTTVLGASLAIFSTKIVSALRGPVQKIEIADAPSNLDFNCFLASWNSDKAEDTCKESKASDGSSCIWCMLEGDAAGACLSNSEASMADGQFGLSCKSEDKAEVSSEPESATELPDFNCFKAAWIAENAEDACGVSKAVDGTNCVWCSVQGDAAGACLSSSEAEMANGQFGLSCPSNEDITALF